MYLFYIGCNLQTEHERYLAEIHYKSPVFVTNYPTNIKAFYMKRNDDGKTVRAFDLLVPKLVSNLHFHFYNMLFLLYSSNF